MIVSAAVLLGAIAAAVWLPSWLARLGALRWVPPRALIAGWVFATVGVLVSAVIAVLLLLVPTHELAWDPLASINDCWSWVRHGLSPRHEELSGLVGVVALSALAARFVVVGSRMARRRAAARRERLAVLRLAARVEAATPRILWLAHDRPLAFSLPGRPDCIVATDGLSRHLNPQQLRAVLEHERAHLRGRHHLIIGVADAVAAAFSFLPLCRAAPEALGELIELAADATAARKLGADTVRSALLQVTAEAPPGPALAFGHDAISTRLDRLAATTRCTRLGTWARHGAACGLAGGAAALPFLAGAVVFSALSVLFCQSWL